MAKADHSRSSAPLGVHFFTIVLNGEPFIRHHIGVFKSLPFPWHWHVIEGVAALNHDTSWSLRQGGAISPDAHRHGLSIDGTSAYLDGLRAEHASQITIYRKPQGAIWDGKIEMVNAPLADIRDECVLWQVDADELWTVEQVCAVRTLFEQHSNKTAAYFFCHYFLGEDLITTTRNTYGNQTSYEWLRVWRFRPGARWFSHEPPRLCWRGNDGPWRDLAAENPFTHRETEAHDLIFQHFAYVTEPQLRFKETYYGYKGALAQWRKLQACRNFPVLLRDYFPWVTDDAAVNRVPTQTINPVARRNVLGQWRFRPQELPAHEPKIILFVRPDSIGDTVLAASMLTHIRDKYPYARLVVVCQEQAAEIYEASPWVDEVLAIHRQKAIDDRIYRETVANRILRFRVDLCLNSVYSREPLTDFLALCSKAPERIAFDGGCELIDPETKAKHNSLYSHLIQSTLDSKPELNRHGDFLRSLGIEAPPLRPMLWLTSEDEQFAEDFFRRHHLDSARTIALFAGAQSDARVYPHYGQALAELDRAENFAFIGLGSAQDFETNQRHLAFAASKGQNLSGELTLRQTAAILKRCRLAVGAETALAHMACAVGTPNVVILGGGHFGRFMPYSPLTSAVCLPLECFGCNWRCRYLHPHCVKDINPQVLTEAIRQSLTASSDRPRIFVQGNTLWPSNSGMPRWRWFDKLIDSNSVAVIRIG